MAVVRGMLDTAVVIAPEATNLPEEAAISSATLLELHFGVYLDKDEQTRSSSLSPA